MPFRNLLRNISNTFYHSTITTEELEDYISMKTGKNLKPFFDQYLRTTKIPTLEYKIKKNTLKYRYRNCVDEFDMPIKIKADKEIWINPTAQWQTIAVTKSTKRILLNRNVYLKLLKVR